MGGRRMHRTLFFDLDGTLTDPKEGITRCVRYALERLESPWPDDDDLAWCIGPPLFDSFRTLVGDERAAQALSYYRERFAEIGWRENRPYPEIADVLQELRAHGTELYVATSKPQVFAHRILSHFGLAEYFTRLFGAELDGTRSRKAELLRHALAEIGGAAAAVMIGDRQHDIAGARSNGMTAVGVSWGYGSREELESAGADLIVDDPRSLLAAFGESGRAGQL